MTEASVTPEQGNPNPNPEEVPPPPRPDDIRIADLHKLRRSDLVRDARELSLKQRTNATFQQLVVDRVNYHLAQGATVIADAVVDSDGQRSHLRWPEFDFRPTIEDVLVPNALLREHGLSPGLKVVGTVRRPRQKEQGLVLDQVISVEGIPIAEWKQPTDFEKLTALFPEKRIFLDNPNGETEQNLGARAVDLIAPLGKGQRGLIVASPRAGKTVMLKEIAKAIQKNHPEIHLILLLVDERPEEVTDFRRELDCEIACSTFDEVAARHVQVTELVAERAKRLVELKRDVVILVDSITRLSRGYNNLTPSKGGRTMSGGVDAKALARPKRFFGAARNVEEGGSLTILATALVGTQSRMDDLIFEEYKGTGNMEVHLDRSIAELRIFPAIHITQSATRREELLYHPDEYERVIGLRRQLQELPAAEAMEILVANLKTTDSNAELLLAGLKGV